MKTPHAGLKNDREPDEEPTLEERISARETECARRARDHEDAIVKAGASFNPYRTDWQPRTVRNRGRKSRPREVSSKRPVPVGRDRCLGIDGANEKGRSLRNFDPRFEEHCGDLNEDHVDRNFSFVENIRERHRRHLEKVVKTEVSNPWAARTLARMEQEDLRRKANTRRKEILKKAKDEEKEAVKQGKKPYFLKEKDIRRLETEAKFEDIRKTGGLQKYIVKRRRRMASKDRKLLPQRRNIDQEK